MATFYRIPSIKSLSRINSDKAVCRRARLWLEWGAGRLASAPETFPVPGYVSPGKIARSMAAAAFLLSDGLESSFSVYQDQEHWPNFVDGPAWEALNMGDPYLDTLICRWSGNVGNLSVACWGDLPEVRS